MQSHVSRFDSCELIVNLVKRRCPSITHTYTQLETKKKKQYTASKEPVQLDYHCQLNFICTTTDASDGEHVDVGAVAHLQPQMLQTK